MPGSITGTIEHIISDMMLRAGKNCERLNAQYDVLQSPALMVAEERGEFNEGKSSQSANAPPAQSGSTAHATTVHPGMSAPKDGEQANRKPSVKRKKLAS